MAQREPAPAQQQAEMPKDDPARQSRLKPRDAAAQPSPPAEPKTPPAITDWASI